MNSDWHKANRMPKNASLEQRVDWHRRHALHCDCRKMPETIRKILEERHRLPGRENHDGSSGR